MPVRRIVPDVHAENPGASRAFYVDVLGLEVAMDLGWVDDVRRPRQPAWHSSR